MTRTKERSEFLTDVLVTAVEGGIGYWAEAKDYTLGSDRPGDGRDRYASAVVREAYDYEVGPWRSLTLATIERGIRRLASGKYALNHTMLGWILSASATNDATDIDSDCADIIVQGALLDSIVYG